MAGKLLDTPHGTSDFPAYNNLTSLGKIHATICVILITLTNIEPLHIVSDMKCVIPDIEWRKIIASSGLYSG